MAGQPLSKGPRTFDDAKLGSMVEPLTVRIDKRKGSSRTPIPMPPGEDGQVGGTGLTKDDIRNLEQWLVNEWAGGGYYEITVTDSSLPTQLIMKWEPFWNPAEYPEKTPPTLAEASAAAAAARPVSAAAPLPPQPQVIRPMAASPFPGGFPPGLPMPSAPNAPQQQPVYGGGYGYYGQPYGAGFGQQQQYSQQAWQAEAERRRTEDERRKAEDERRAWETEMKKKEAELQAAREQAMRKDHEAALERERVAANERVKAIENQMGELRGLMTQLAATVQQNGAQAQASAQKNPELEALREQNRMVNERLEREQREREAERRDAALREMIKAQADASQRSFEALQRQFETQVATLAKATENRGPDPAFTLVKEIIAQNSQSMKDVSHQNQLQFERMQGLMMKPQDLMLLTKESQGSIEQITNRMSSYFGNVLDMQSRVMEQALQMQPQGGGAAELVREGMTGLKDLAERYVGSQQAKATVAAQAQVEMTKAQVRAMEIEAQHRNPQPQPQVVYAPPAPKIDAQLAGPSMGKRGKKGRKAAAEVPGPLDSPKRLGRTDFEWFGPLMGEVIQLREGVAKYIESLAMEPKRLNKEGEPDGISVEQAAGGVVMAMSIVMQQQLPIPAMVDLLNQQRYADFMDVLLPDAPQPYRDDAVTAVIAQLKQVGIDKPAVDASKPGNTVAAADDDDDDDDDDGDGDDDDGADDADDPNADENDGKVVPIPTKGPRNGKRPVVS